VIKSRKKEGPIEQEKLARERAAHARQRREEKRARPSGRLFPSRLEKKGGSLRQIWGRGDVPDDSLTKKKDGYRFKPRLRCWDA